MKSSRAKAARAAADLSRGGFWFGFWRRSGGCRVVVGRGLEWISHWRRGNVLGNRNGCGNVARSGRGRHRTARHLNRLALTVGAAAVGVDQTIVVVGVLEIPFRSDPIAGGNGFPRQGQVFVEHLLGRTPDFYVRTGTLHGMGSGGWMVFPAASGTPPSRIGPLFHCYLCVLLR